MIENSKVRSSHTRRAAIMYIRQSHPSQVENNRESTARQYALVEKAMALQGPRFLHILSPCPLGWDHEAAASVQVARLAVETGLFPLVELEYGAVTGVMRLAQPRPVEEYLRLQGRFKHLFREPRGAEEVRHLQALADANIRRYGLRDAPTTWDTDEAGRVQRGGRGGYVTTPEHLS